ncbi:uncharacterized protein BT62DRAFT_684218 [Guyanagaster necrorhizus]|uniref:Uncharacterized protein n=1 Tax=Guyanagaster necrorhizus TaxID=856835 RepID=A0A9P7VZH4_9AGAR|nr:uncharacterized protein BT62DRAFT_684218 [Guyanagaster necrorhizus MCA 3950]KAG7449438.1 hypothetical protein BT62DRAFT_684218 [Guyanagaster necrorhizus MCA 3950]
MRSMVSQLRSKRWRFLDYATPIRSSARILQFNPLRTKRTWKYTWVCSYASFLAPFYLPWTIVHSFAMDGPHLGALVVFPVPGNLHFHFRAYQHPLKLQSSSLASIMHMTFI